jgi:hypothetical protein
MVVGTTDYQFRVRAAERIDGHSSRSSPARGSSGLWLFAPVALYIGGIKGEASEHPHTGSENYGVI